MGMNTLKMMGINMKSRIVKRTIVLAIVGMSSFGLFNDAVYASSGTGSGGSGVCTDNCGEPEWWGVYPDSDGTSGISWKMFRTKDKYYKKYQLYKTSYEKGPVYCKDREKQESEGCSGNDIIGGLRGGGYDKKLATKCSKAGYDWYAVLAFDGWYKADKSKVRYFGPSAVGATYEGYYGGDVLFYRDDTIQTKNQLSKKATLAALENGTLAEGSRVDKTAVKYFCQMDKTSSLCANYNGGTLPKGLGYICVGDSEWQAQSIASRTKGGAAIATAGYSDDTKTGKGYIDNCDPVKGCNVHFTHNIKRTAGSGTTSYKVTRTSNMTKSDDKNKGIDNNSNVKSGNSNSDGSVKQASTSGPFKLYPGMRLCERITFKSHGAANSPNVYTEVCVYALGDAQPGNPGQPNNPGGTPDDKENPDTNSGDTSFINIKVRNSSVTKKYNEYQRFVYAKPNDVLMYRATYWPNLQYTYNLHPSKIQIITGSSNGSPINNNNSSKLGALFNAKRGSLGTWKNGFTIERKKMESDNNDFSKASYVGDYNYNVGETDKKRPNPHSVTVSMDDVGKSVNERAITSYNSTNQTTPGQVTFVKDNLGKIDTRSRYQVAKARVPYNFEIEAEIKDRVTDENSPDPDVVFAGEEITINYNIDINERKNCLTTDNCSEEEAYATKVNDARRELVIYDPAVVPEKSGGVVSGNRSADICQSYFGHVADKINCGYSADITENLNPGSNPIKSSFLNQDKSAGSRVCVAAAVFPANSGAENNWNDTQYSKTWRISNSMCFTIAKRPSLQVWGGNIYSRGKVSTATSTKYNLAGYGEYKIEGKDNPHVFGSFGELGLIASGSVKGLASGAATGYASIDANGILSPDPFSSNNTSATAPGGGTKSSICDRSPLTFSNTPCSSNTVGELGKTATTSNVENDKTRVLEKLVRELDEGQHTATSPVILNNPEYKQSSGIYYYYNDNDLEIGDGTQLSADNPVPMPIDNSTIQVVHSENTVLVKDNIAYNGTYSKYSDLPKLVIYGKNVVIDCRVTRIDALIVADEKVVTCNNYNKDINTTNDADFKKDIDDHINEAANSNPLKVNGAIVAKTLISNRTYGAATGVNSIIPAEIINFDPTLYMWGNLGDDDGDDNGELEVTLTKELAPRR